MFVSKSEDTGSDKRSVCTMSQGDLMEIIRVVEDPDLGISIVDLGLVYDVRNDNKGRVEVDMTLTSPGCPYGPQIVQEVNYVLRAVEGVHDVEVEIVWDPPWTLDNLSDEVKLDMGIDY
jgi:metal-sulfur cluster biosynthetic enzyme